MKTLKIRVKDKHSALLGKMAREVNTVAMRTCNACREAKPHSDFSADRRNKSGLQGKCKSCSAQVARQWRSENQERHRETQKQWEKLNPERHLLSKFGIRVGEKRAIFEKQGGVCGACGASEHGHPRLSGESGWCLDHCHSSGAVRGVLCWRCNLALGYAEDSPEKLRALAEYLESHRNAALNIRARGLASLAEGAEA